MQTSAAWMQTRLTRIMHHSAPASMQPGILNPPPVLVGGNHPQPIPDIVLLEVLLCQVLQVPERQGHNQAQ